AVLRGVLTGDHVDQRFPDLRTETHLATGRWRLLWRHERLPELGLDERQADHDERDHNRYLDEDDHVVDGGRPRYTDHEQHRDRADRKDRGQIQRADADCLAGFVIIDDD